MFFSKHKVRLVLTSNLKLNIMIVLRKIHIHNNQLIYKISSLKTYYLICQNLILMKIKNSSSKIEDEFPLFKLIAIKIIY
jgi:hypothetical protein